MNGTDPPRHLDVKRDRGVSIQWTDGSVSYYSVKYLRRWSPSAEAKQMREQLAKNPLTVLPTSAVGSGDKPLRIDHAEFVGHYAIKFIFSDGHSTGIYTWDYLRDIDPRHIAQRRIAEGEESSVGPNGGRPDGIDPEGEAWRRESETRQGESHEQG